MKYPEDDRASYEDCITDILLTHNITVEELLWHLLPEHTQFTALQWGLSDTPFRDEVWSYFSDKLKTKP